MAKGTRLFALSTMLAAEACLLTLPLDGYEGSASDAGVGDAITESAADANGPDSATVDAAPCPPDKLAHRTSCITRPVAYWPLDEGSGQTVGDQSGNGVTGTVSGARWVAGHIGTGALAFDGVSAQVLFGQPSQLSFARSSFSYALLVFQDAPAGEYDVAWWNGGSSAAVPGYDMELGQAGWGASVGDGTKNLVAGFGPPVSGKWTRLVVVVDREKAELRTYQNAVLSQTRSLADMGSLAPAETAVLGSGRGEYFFKGTIDDVLVFDRVPTPEDLLELNP